MADKTAPLVPMIRIVRLPLAFVTGAGMALGAPPYDLWYVAFACLCAAFWLFERAPKSVLSAGTGWAVGLGYFGLALGWIIEPFQIDPATRWMAPFGLFGLAAGLALFWALPFWVAGHARRFAMAVLVVGWAVAELMRAYVLTGFPWAMLPYFWLETPVIQWVAVLGPHGLGVATLALAALVARMIFAPAARRVCGAGALILALVLWGGGLWLTPAEQDLTGRPLVRLVQPNAAQHEKWDPDKIPIFFDRQVAYTAAEAPVRPALVVWPEISVPWMLHRAEPALQQIARAAGGATAILGIQRVEDGRYFNALVALGPDAQVTAVYDKHHLVPFGEYMPAAALFRHWNIFGLAARAEGGYSPGPGPSLIQIAELGRALPLICYEAVFPQDVNAAPGRADFLLHLTNDAWFGTWSGPYQHLAQSRIRSIEQGLPMLRAANTGVSAAIDPYGRTIASLPLGEAGFVDVTLPAPLSPTPYARTGDWPVLALLAALMVGAGILARRLDAPSAGP